MKTTNLISILLCFLSIQLSAQNTNGNSQNKVPLEELIKQKNSSYVITSKHTSSVSGIHHVYLRQAINGLEVKGTESSVHLDKQGKAAVTNNNFIDAIESTLISTSVNLTSEQAIISVSKQKGYTISNLQALKNEDGINKKAIYSKAGISREEIPVQLMYYYRKGIGTLPVWELSVQEIDSDDWWVFRVDAGTGQIIDTFNMTLSCNLMESFNKIDSGQNHVKSADKTSKINQTSSSYNYTVPTENNSLVGNYLVYAMPVESPNHGDRTLVANPDNSLASPYGWHDVNGSAGSEYTITRGNNVWATEDRNDNNIPGHAPDGGLGQNYIFPVDFTQDPIISEDAAITNLFYWNNIMHDVFYQYGFDEASGNFQENNYGNGGLGSDSVNADAQNPGNCNAAFATPIEGQNPRMAMYLCNRSNPSRDGDFDNGVIAHEYGHGISQRLTGGSFDIECLDNEEQMGEGWSDFFGYMLTMEAGDSGSDIRGVGSYLFGQPVNGYGIRRQPYSTDFARNPFTYNSIKSEVAPHGVGSVWAMMLIEMAWELIDVYGFDPDFYNGSGGNNIALALVTEALKLQPCSPGFVDGRNAIVAADIALYGGANRCYIWYAFARRGLGYSATQGSTDSKMDGTEAFNFPPNVALLDTIDDICLVGGVQTGLSGGIPTGGVYSGLGVTDDGNGSTFSFDPSVTGTGPATITYDIANSCSAPITDVIEVTNNPPKLICKGTGAIPTTNSAFVFPRIPILNNTTITSTIQISQDVIIKDLNISLNISHTLVSDLLITIQSPAGTIVTIFNPFFCGGNDIITLLDDEAPTSSDFCYSSGTNDPAYPDPSYRPHRFLSAFNGENTAGVWTISIEDQLSSDEGILTRWGLNYAYDAVAPPHQVFLDGTGNATVNAEDLLYNISVDCGAFSVLAGSPPASTVSFNILDIGLNTVEVFAENDLGAMSSCNANVIVTYTGPPGLNISCPPNMTVECGSDISPASTGMATVTSDCDPNPLISFTDSSSTGCGNTEVITRTWITADNCGNTVDSCDQTITVVDTTMPVASCPSDIIVNTDSGMCGAIVNYVVNGIDSCGGITVNQTAGMASGDLFPLGTTTNSFNIVDDCGNVASCSFTVTVNDIEAPIANCAAGIVVQLDANGNGGISVSEIDNGSFDNCGIDQLFIDINTFNCSNVGPNPVELTVIDASGNSSNCTAIVLVEDITPPSVICTDITVQLDSTGMTIISGIDIDGGSADACGIDSFDLDITTFDCTNVGSNLVELTVTDINGNSASCTAVVTVEDNISPNLVCKNITVELGASGTVVITPDDVIETLEDACGIAIVAIDIATFNCGDIGTPITVNVFANDIYGNLSTCSAEVTIVDLLAPVISCPVNQTVDPGPNNIFYELPDYFDIGLATTADNCTDPILITTQDPTAGTLLPDGSYTIILGSEDEYGNIASCEFDLIVESVLGIDDPTLALDSIKIYPNPAGDYIILSNNLKIPLKKLSIFDLKGRSLKAIDLTNMESEFILNVSDLSSAMYMIVIEGIKSKITKQLIKN